MQTLKTIIVDDEEGARDILTNVLTNFIQDVEIVSSCAEVKCAVKEIKKHKPHLVFLDVEMPEYNGFEMLQFFDSIDFEIVFVTAYSDYALKAFQVSAIDYVLKPIQIDKLEAAVEKVRSKVELSSMHSRLELLDTNLSSDKLKKLALPMSDGLIFVDIDDIVCLEADGSYTRVCLIERVSHLISKKIKFFEEALSEHSKFIRVHRSSIINLGHINNYIRQSGMITLNNTKEIKVARDRKAKFESALNGIRV